MISTSSAASLLATTTAAVPSAKRTAPASRAGALLPFLPKEGDTTNSLLAEAESFKSQFELSKNKAESSVTAKTSYPSSKVNSSLLGLKNKDSKLKDKKLLPHAQNATNAVLAPVTPAVPDTRSWALSLPSASGTAPKETKAAPATTAITNPSEDLKSLLKSGAPDSTQAHALQRTEIAFTVTVHPEEQLAATKQSTAGEQSQTDTKSLESEKSVAPTAGHFVPGIAKGSSSSENNNSSKHSSSSHSEDRHSETAARDAATSASSFIAPATGTHSGGGGASQPSAPATVHSSPLATAATTATAPPSQPAYNAPHKLESPSTVSTATGTIAEDSKPIAIPKPQSIDLKVGQADGSQVDVRVSQRAGDVQVTVRTADGDLAQSLRHHLPELSDRLAQNGTPGDFWQPSGAQGFSSHFSESDHREQSTGGNESHARGGQQRDADDRSQSNDPNEDNRQTAWFQEMNNAQTRY